MGRCDFGRKRKAGNWSARGPRLYAIGAGGGPGRRVKIIPRDRNACAGRGGEFAHAVTGRLDAWALRPRAANRRPECGPDGIPTYGRALCVTFPTISATAPAKGRKVKRTTCRPRGQTTARKITSALRISAS